MQYFTKDEAKRIINCQPIGLCFYNSSNPNVEAMVALAESIDSKPDASPFFAACTGFILGRATGVREERARRKGTST